MTIIASVSAGSSMRAAMEGRDLRAVATLAPSIRPASRNAPLPSVAINISDVCIAADIHRGSPGASFSSSSSNPATRSDAVSECWSIAPSPKSIRLGGLEMLKERDHVSRRRQTNREEDLRAG